MDDHNLSNKGIAQSRYESEGTSSFKRTTDVDLAVPYLKRIKVRPPHELQHSFEEETILGTFGGEEPTQRLRVVQDLYPNVSNNENLTETDNHDSDIKPDIKNLINDTPHDEFIKREIEEFDENNFSIHTEITIKNEPFEDMSEDVFLSDEVVPQPNTTLHETIEPIDQFLFKNPEVFTKFCGLYDIGMFYALFDYIKPEMKDIQEATKFEQLFSVLAKLHKNEDNLYINKYLFPSTYVYIVQLLYKKLGVLSRKITSVGITELLAPHFDLSQKVIIIGVITIKIKNTLSNLSNTCASVKYLIAYTTFGDVFFVSKRFSGESSLNKLLHYSGLLRKLEKDFWILFHEEENVFVTQVEKLNIRGAFYKEELYSKTIQTYTLQVVNRLTQHFKVLQSKIPDFMLYNEDKTCCFLDELVFVCCMILNMLPRCAYK